MSNCINKYKIVKGGKLLQDVNPVERTLQAVSERRAYNIDFAKKILCVDPDTSRTIYYCGTHLELDSSDGSVYKHNFCRGRWCPTCQWRKSRKLAMQNQQMCEWVVNKYAGVRFVFLTLTVPNVPVSGLRAKLKDMSVAWNRLKSNRSFKKFKILGCLRVCEVTYNPTANTWHPHYHILLAVAAGEWLPDQSWWLQLWRTSCRDNTIHILDIRTVKGMSTSGVSKELSHYIVKSKAFYGNDWVLDFPHLKLALARVRCYNPSGCFREAIKALGLCSDPDQMPLNDTFQPSGDVVKYDWSFELQCFSFVGLNLDVIERKELDLNVDYVISDESGIVID